MTKAREGLFYIKGGGFYLYVRNWIGLYIAMVEQSFDISFKRHRFSKDVWNWKYTTTGTTIHTDIGGLKSEKPYHHQLMPLDSPERGAAYSFPSIAAPNFFVVDPCHILSPPTAPIFICFKARFDPLKDESFGNAVDTIILPKKRGNEAHSDWNEVFFPQRWSSSFLNFLMLWNHLRELPTVFDQLVYRRDLIVQMPKTIMNL